MYYRDTNWLERKTQELNRKGYTLEKDNSEIPCVFYKLNTEKVNLHGFSGFSYFDNTYYPRDKVVHLQPKTLCVKVNIENEVLNFSKQYVLQPELEELFKELSEVKEKMHEADLQVLEQAWRKAEKGRVDAIEQEIYWCNKFKLCNKSLQDFNSYGIFKRIWLAIKGNLK